MAFPPLHLRHPHLRSTGWRIVDDDERMLSGAYGIEVAGGLVTLKLAPTSGAGPSYELKGYAIEAGVGIGLKEKIPKGPVREFLDGLEKTEHYKISTGLPGGTVGPLFHRTGRYEVVTPAMLKHSIWFVVGFGATGVVMNGSAGMICLLDPLGQPSPKLSLPTELLVDLAGSAGELYRRTVAWGLLVGLTAAPGLDASASGKGIVITRSEKSGEGSA